MQCKKCGSKFSCHVKINGKSHNLQNRKYCLICSPFKLHNTKILGEKGTPKIIEKRCLSCGKTMHRKAERKGKLCWSCTNKKSRAEKIAKVISLVGNACWFCSYSRCWNALEFHHINPEEKLFGLTVRELQYSWKRIETELKKCVLACACCHREIHCGLIEFGEVERVWDLNWNKGL